MKEIIAIGCVLCFFLSYVSALSIKENFKRQEDLGLSYDVRSSKSSKVGEVCNKYRGEPSKSQPITYSKCYRSEMNKLSMSKGQACGLRDGGYDDILQFNWKFTEDLILQTDNFGFIKLKSKLYYIVTDHIGETDTMRNYYFYSYDCTTKKAKQHYEGKGLWHGHKPLWIDATSSIVYLLKGGPIRGRYDPYKIVQINLKTSTAKEYQLLTENIVRADESKELVTSAFVWKQNLMSLLIDWVEAKGVDSFQWHYGTQGTEFTTLIDEIVDIRSYDTIVTVSNIKAGVGKLMIEKPGYTVSAEIDFNKKIIK